MRVASYNVHQRHMINEACRDAHRQILPAVLTDGVWTAPQPPRGNVKADVEVLQVPLPLMAAHSKLYFFLKKTREFSLQHTGFTPFMCMLAVLQTLDPIKRRLGLVNGWVCFV